MGDLTVPSPRAMRRPEALCGRRNGSAMPAGPDRPFARARASVCVRDRGRSRFPAHQLSTV